MATTRGAWLGAISGFVALGCGPAATDTPSAAAPSPSSTAPAAPAACRGPGEEFTAATGETVRAHGLAVTYGGTMHDDYMDGGFDEIAQLKLQGVMDDGTLTPSAMEWSPSALAPPEWVYFPRIGLCMRLEEAHVRRARFRILRLD